MLNCAHVFNLFSKMKISEGNYTYENQQLILLFCGAVCLKIVSYK